MKSMLRLPLLLKLIGLLVLLTAANGCNTLDLKEKTFYGSEASSGCVEFYEFSQLTVQHPGNFCIALWNNLSNPMVMLSSSTLAETQKEVEDACAQLGNCTEPAVAKALVSIRRANKMMTKIRYDHIGDDE